MASKVFLDANVLLDLILKRPGAPAAQIILDAGIRGTIQLFTTPAVLHVTCYFTRKSYSQKHTNEILLTLLNDVTVIDCDHATARNALTQGALEDVEDALQYFTAIRFDLDCFLSSDQDLKKSSLPQLPVYTPAELIAELLPA